VKRYRQLYGAEAPLQMSAETFEALLAHIPKDAALIFAGFYEPFANPEFPDMLATAHRRGHDITLYTTLWGIRKEDLEILKDIKFNKVCLHLPDGQIMKEPCTDSYRDLFFEFTQTVRNIEYMSMNAAFISNNRENVVRGNLPKPRPYGWCSRFHEILAPTILPNGEAVLCCNDFALRNPVGNLLNESFESIKKRLLANEGKFFECQYCSWNQPRIRRNLFTLAKKVTAML
jgi:MoaA/NifB/PqqE/SkfB family radical SAM enzyme